MNKREVVKLLDMLVELYPYFEISNLKIELWEQCLENIEFNVAKQNVISYAQSSKYIPTIAEVRGTVKTGKEPKRDDFCEVTQQVFELYEPTH